MAKRKPDSAKRIEICRLKALGLLLLFCLAGIEIFAQNELAAELDSIKLLEPKRYFHEYQDAFTISPYTSLNALGLTFSHEREESFSPEAIRNSTVNYVSNNRQNIGLAFGYRGLYIAGSRSLPIYNFPVQRYGSSDYTDLGFGFSMKGIRFSGWYHDYTGLAEESATSRFPNFGVETPLPFRRDYRLQEYLLRGTWFFKRPKFSYNVAFNVTGQQLKSSNSFFLDFTGSYQKLSSRDSLLIPMLAAAYYKNPLDFQRINSFSVGLMPGWGGIVTGKHFFLAGVISLGGRFCMLDMASEQSLVPTGAIESRSQLIIGYNRPRWYIMNLTNVSVYQVNVKDFAYNQTFTENVVEFGWRLHRPQFAKFLGRIPILEAFL